MAGLLRSGQLIYVEKNESGNLKVKDITSMDDNETFPLNALKQKTYENGKAELEVRIEPKLSALNAIAMNVLPDPKSNTCGIGGMTSVQFAMEL